MSVWERAFIVAYAIVVFPLLMVFLHLYHHLAVELIKDLLMYMGGLLGVHIGMLVFNGRNDDVEPPTQ